MIFDREVLLQKEYLSTHLKDDKSLTVPKFVKKLFHFIFTKFDQIKQRKNQDTYMTQFDIIYSGTGYRNLHT